MSSAQDATASTSRQATVQRKRTNGSNNRDEKQFIGQWRIGRTIGKGSSGRVKIAKHAVTGKYAAIKIVPKGLILNSRMSMSEAGAKADKVLLGIEREIVIMKLIDHPNVLNLYDVWETSSELYLIMEYVPGGELFDYLVKRGRLPVSEALHYFQQIIHAVDYCHRFNVCHRDLKPENLLLDKDKNIKVADFGMAAWEAGDKMLETSCGSPHYASPEIVAGKAYHGSASDIWSCGIILFALLTGRLPFDDDNIRALLQKVKAGVFEMPDEIKDPARDLLRRMLEKDPERRITMSEILTHPFFVSRPPRPIPGRARVTPPTFDEVERPVNSPEEIDPDIMGNLKTLWAGAPDDQIVDALMCKEKTWEKVIYHLLIKYRNKHLENYNMEEEAYLEARERREARRQSGPSPARRKGTANQAQQPRLAPLGENESVANTPVKRPQAPTPNKASRAKSPMESPTPTKGVQQTRGPAGPRPPTNRGNSANSTATDAPTIIFQGATPTKEIPTAKVTSSRPTSEIIAPASPIINAPQVGDVNLQTFLNQIADQMNRFSVRSSVASQSSETSDAILGSDYQACLAFAAGITPNSAPPARAVTPDTQTEKIEEHGQFEDATDDQTDGDGASIHSTFTASIAPPSPLAGLGLGAPSNRPSLHPVSGPNQQRWSYASSQGSSYRGSSAGSYQPMESPQLSYSPMELQTPAFQSDRSAPAPPPRATRPAPTPASRPLPPSPVAYEPVESLLHRDNSYVIIDNAELPSDASMSSWGSRSSGGFKARGGLDGFGMLKKNKKLTVDPTGYSSDNLGSPSATSSVNSPKRSWFNHLFKFKPATCSLLSHDNVATTRERVRRVLSSLGTRVAVVELDGHKALKCKLDEVREDGGNVTARGVRFRVEFSRASQTTGGQTNTLVTLTQEKGAESSFRVCFAELKHFMDSQPSAPASLSLGSRPAGQTRSYVPPTSPLLSAPPIRHPASAPTTPVVESFPRFGTPYLSLSPQPPTQLPSF
ncbi:hypothetical protein B9479_007986 [Cryptococcus floricola]|uniref:non-specific serine/threonine protein kinase n=1 Tax=Cryptococcus floricola TaxID=2591691 RepID=A0A5D3AN13_9TREE|nr:hypothetical protein B9479_007986 [Cryptococcus floricola]